MGIIDFFKNVGKKIGNAARVGYNFVKDKVLPVAGRIARTGLDFMSKLPGRIGKIGTIGNAVIGTVDKVVDHLPNGGLKDKIKDIIGGVSNTFNNGVNTAFDAANKGNEYANRGRQMYDTIANANISYK